LRLGFIALDESYTGRPRNTGGIVLVVIVDRIISLLIIIPTGLMGWYNLKSSNKQVIIE
jgi:hypothetical protein